MLDADGNRKSEKCQILKLRAHGLNYGANILPFHLTSITLMVEVTLVFKHQKRSTNMPAVKGQKIEAKYDGEKLYALIKEEKAENEIMAELGIVSKTTLKNHLFKLIQEKKEFLAIAGASTRTRTSAPVYKKDRIVLTANMLAGIEFEEGQKFVVKKTEDGLKLKMV